MTGLHSQTHTSSGKLLQLLTMLILCAFALSACSTNPATGKSQFTGLMSPAQENKIGAEEHQKIIQQYGIYKDPKIQAYVTAIGNRVTKKTERPEVTYKFFVLDTPMVNAFALPGGYIYVSRGLLTLANNEAELAGVLAHEAAHITARHSAERYSHGVVTSVGATILSAVLKNSAASQALGTGANLYISGYSRGQENEADALGLRYMSQGGYHPHALPSFLESLNNDKHLAEKIQGRKHQFSYFSTHPPTPERIEKTSTGAKQYPLKTPVTGQKTYFNTINGITYGDSAEQGFTRGQRFYHPVLGFTFEAPEDYTITNQPAQIIAKSKKNAALMVFDFAADKTITNDPAAFMAQRWVKDEKTAPIERIKVHGMNAATTTLEGTINRQPMTIRLMAIQWEPGKYARFQIAMPKNLSATDQKALRTSSYSFRRMSAKEKRTVKPYHIKIITARSGDTVSTLSKRMALTEYREDHFRLLNSLASTEGIIAGRRYKIVSQ